MYYINNINVRKAILATLLVLCLKAWSGEITAHRKRIS